MLISVVIPLYNEEALIEKLFKRVMEATEKATSDFEVICVDDGSSDLTLTRLLECRAHDVRFKVVELSRNFGHQAAYTAGLSVAKGQFVVMLDGDLQDPPELIPGMFQNISDHNFDIVYGRRLARKEKFIKRNSINLFHRIFSRLSGINAPANVGNFAMMNRVALDAFLSLNEKNRYLPGLRYFIGFKQGYVDYVRPDRQDGEPKMNFIKLSGLAFDAIFSFSKIPIKIALFIGTIGLFMSLAGAAIVICKKFTGVAITGWTSTMLTLYFFGSVQLFFLGVLGEYIFRIYKETQNRPVYIIRKYYE